VATHLVFLVELFFAGAAFLALGDFLAFGLGEALGDFLVLRDLTLFFFDEGLLALGDAFALGDDLDTTRKVLLWPAAVARTPVSIPRNRTSRGKVEVRDS